MTNLLNRDKINTITKFIKYKTRNIYYNDFMSSDDLKQDCFQRIIENIEKFNKKKSSFNTWALKIIDNTIINFINKQKNKKEIPHILTKRITNESFNNIKNNNGLVCEDRLVYKNNLFNPLQNTWNNDIKNKLANRINPFQNKIIGLKLAGLKNKEISDSYDIKKDALVRELKKIKNIILEITK